MHPRPTPRLDRPRLFPLHVELAPTPHLIGGEMVQVTSASTCSSHSRSCLPFAQVSRQTPASPTSSCELSPLRLVRDRDGDNDTDRPSAMECEHHTLVALSQSSACLVGSLVRCSESSMLHL